MRGLRAAAILAVVALVFYLASLARDALGIEFEPESIQAWVSSLGWTGPLIYLLLVIFRHFLVLPSAIILPAGGAVFGTLGGTALGALGILVTAMANFGLGRGIAADWIDLERFRWLVPLTERIELAGPFVVGIVTAHPIGPMTPFHWAAGFAAMRAVPYTVAVALGATTRAFVLSFFGSTLLEVGSPRFWLAMVVFAAIAVVPLLHRRTRKRLLGTG